MDTQKLKADFGTIRWDGERLTGIVPDFAPQMVKDPIVATNATPHNAAELVKRYNSHPELLAALEQMEMTFGDTAFAESEAGQDALTQARTLLTALKAQSHEVHSDRQTDALPRAASRS